jgi:hypothetical protein
LNSKKGKEKMGKRWAKSKKKEVKQEDKSFEQLELDIDTLSGKPKTRAKKKIEVTFNNNTKLKSFDSDFGFITELEYTEKTGLALPRYNDNNKSKEVDNHDNTDSNIIEEKSNKVEDKTVEDNEDSIETKNFEKENESQTSDDANNTIENKVVSPEKENTGHSEEKTTKEEKIDSTGENLVEHSVKMQPAYGKNGSFISAVNEANKIKEEHEKEELSHVNPDYPYKPVQIMTNAEKQLFLFMENNLIDVDRIRIIPKVRLADIIDVEERVCKDKEALWKITSKHVDFIIVDKYTFDLICAVELDDYTHDKPERKERDQFVFFALLAAGISLYRIKCKIADITKEDLRGIEESILMYYRKPCAFCGADTRVMSKSSGAGKGHRFYSCTNFPNCRCTVNID